MDREIKRKVMKRAHEIARRMVGPYRARMSIALQISWKEAKEGMEKKELPQLIGSEKQVKWAEDIRSEVLRVLEKCRFIVEQVKPEKMEERLTKKEYQKAKEWVEAQDKAFMFIERFRFMTAKKADRYKAEDLRKVFGRGGAFFTIALNYWSIYDEIKGTREG